MEESVKRGEGEPGTGDEEDALAGTPVSTQAAIEVSGSTLTIESLDSLDGEGEAPLYAGDHTRKGIPEE